MWPIAADVARSVCLYVCVHCCVLGTRWAVQKWLNRSRWRLGADSRRNSKLDGGQDQTNLFAAARSDKPAMEPLAKLPRTFVNNKNSNVCATDWGWHRFMYSCISTEWSSETGRQHAGVRRTSGGLSRRSLGNNLWWRFWWHWRRCRLLQSRLRVCELLKLSHATGDRFVLKSKIDYRLGLLIN